MITKKILILPAFFLFCGLQGQRDVSNIYQEYLNAKRTGSSYAENVQGSPYENPDFVLAKVFMNGVQQPLHTYIRYNSFEDEMEFRKEKEGQILVISNNRLIDSIVVNNSTYLYREFIDEGKVPEGFFVRLADGDASLFRKTSKKFQEEKPPASGYDQYKPAAFIEENDEFYVSFEGAPLLKIPSRGKKIPELFREYGFENEKMSKVRYQEEDLVEYFRGLKKTP